MFARLIRLFRPLDTSEVDAAIASAHAEQRQVRVRARALRMDVSCGDPAQRMEAFVRQFRGRAGAVLREIYPVPTEPLPAPLQQLLDRL